MFHHRQLKKENTHSNVNHDDGDDGMAADDKLKCLYGHAV